MKNATPSQIRIGLRVHAIALFGSIIVLAVVNYLIGKPYWIVWVVLSGGVGLLSHWLSVQRHLGHGASAELG